MSNGELEARLEKSRDYAKELESRLKKVRNDVGRMEANLRNATCDDVESAQAVRGLINRLRVGAWMPGEELDDRADIPLGSTSEFEIRQAPLTEGERRKMVAMLEVLLVCRRGYRDSVLQWREATGMTRRQAAFVIGITKNNYAEIERGTKKWPHAKTRDAIDRVLTDWENLEAGKRAAAISAFKAKVANEPWHADEVA